MHVLTRFYLNMLKIKMRNSRNRRKFEFFTGYFLRRQNQTLHYDSLLAFGFKETSCLQFEEKLQFKHFYAELLESEASLKLNAFADIRRDVKISALAQI